MIIDRIENCSNYTKLGKNISAALEYLRTTDFGRFEKGRHEIDGNKMYLLLNEYATKDALECKIEAHRRYIDVQYMLKGTEQVGYAPLAGQTPATEYDEKNDYTLYSGHVSCFDFTEGMFAIFYPEDLHMPGIGEDQTPVRKAVIKVKI
jgi:YhcH/YjgK/YiaL family protein